VLLTSSDILVICLTSLVFFSEAISFKVNFWHLWSMVLQATCFSCYYALQVTQPMVLKHGMNNK